MTACARSVMVLSRDPVCWLMAVSSDFTRWNSELVKLSARSASVLSSTMAP